MNGNKLPLNRNNPFLDLQGMANTYFRFKQFIIHQEKTAMKVCTDACLFGAWVSDTVSTLTLPASRILDIGTGTGLLSLILAQKLEGSFDALEINDDAFEQATENIKASTWNNRIKAIHTDVLHFHPGQKYELIISNPPFFENALRSGHAGKNLSKHESGLQLQELFAVVKNWLTDEGQFALLLPANRMEQALDIANDSGMYCRKLVIIRQSTAHNPFRVMFIFSLQPFQQEREEIIIKDSHNNYTPGFIKLLHPYYLNL